MNLSRVSPKITLVNSSFAPLAAGVASKALAAAVNHFSSPSLKSVQILILPVSWVLAIPNPRATVSAVNTAAFLIFITFSSSRSEQFKCFGNASMP